MEEPSLQKREKIFVVSLRGVAPWISRVEYEKDEKDLRLFFALKEGEISPENLSLQALSNSTPIVENQAGKYKLAKKILSLWGAIDPLGLYIACLEKKDFEDSAVSPKELPLVMQSLAQRLEKQSSLLLIWGEQAPFQKGILWTQNKELRQKIGELVKGKERGNWALFEMAEPSLAHAKDRLLSLFMKESSLPHGP